MQRALLLLLIGGSYALFAGAPPWTATPLIVASLLTLAAGGRHAFRFPAAHRALDLALAAGLAALLLQIAPLPLTLVDAVSPHTVPLARSLSVGTMLSTAASSQTLSIEPRDTWWSFLTVAMGVLAFWSARAALSSGGIRQFCRWLAFLGAAVAVAALINRATAPGTVFGLVRPEARSANPFGAFVNRNHFAGWLLMTSAPVLGYLVAHARTHPGYDRPKRLFREALRSGGLLISATVVLMLGTIFLSLSRSAAAGVGVAAVTGWWLVRQRVKIERAAWPPLLAAAGLAVLLVVLFVDPAKWSARIGSSFDVDATGFSRLVIWRETLPILRDFPLAGTGAGTYSPVMTVYQQTRFWVGSMQQWAHFNQAHSHYLQVAAEGGLLLAVPALAALLGLGLLGRRAIDQDRGEIFWVRVGAAAGLAGIAVQSVWEIPLVMPANAILAGVLAGVLLHERHEPGRHGGHKGY